MNDLYEFPPRKRTITYGKSTNKRTPTIPNEGSKTADSATEPSGTSRTSVSHSSSPEPGPRSRPVVPSSKSKLVIGSTSATDRSVNRGTKPAQPRVSKEVQSQPLPATAGLGASLREDDGDAALKKRKLTRTYSDRKVEADLYDIPDSPPRLSRPTVKKVRAKVVEEREVVPKPARVPKPAQKPVAKQAPKRSQTPERDFVMEDVAPQQTAPFSAKTSKALVDLHVSLDSPPRVKQGIPIRPSNEASKSSQPVNRKRLSPPPNPSGSKRTVSGGPRKRRLIDALAEQAEESEEEEESSQPSTVPTEVRPREKIEPAEINFRDASPDAPPGSQSSQTSKSVLSVAGAKRGGPRFTYSQQRTMLFEEDPLFAGMGLGSIDEDVGNGSMFDFGRLPKASTINTFAFLDEDEETSNTGAVKSLHELRQAGANSRFADEMDDILDRIGLPSAKPSSLRRGALLELAQKISNRAFRQQFRDHSDHTKVFKSLGDEIDVISAYSILTVLATLLAASSSVHLVRYLLEQNITELFGRLLGEATDISVVAKDRKQNASKHVQGLIAAVKASLLVSPIWEPCSPTSLSPRTVALKCLDLIRLQPGPSSTDDSIFTKKVTDRLFSVLSAGASDESCWEFPTSKDSTDFYLAFYLVEHHSAHAMQSKLSPVWTREYVPIVVSALKMALQRPVAGFHELESLALRLALNVTNNNSEASQMFVDQDLLQEVAKSACSAFDIILNSMTENEVFLAKVHESLVLMLAVMINFCAYYAPAARRLEEHGEKEADSALVGLIRVFAENHTRTSDADSIQKSSLNVALGYLSIVLGYLCLSAPIRGTFVRVHPKNSIQPLLESIAEFIAVHNQVEEVQETQSGAMARLQRLLDQLRS
ncbi:hypothetical protein OQA88_6148 [Cercophora sp. LCS_1]